MLHSYTGKLLVIDLTNGDIDVQLLNENYAKEYIGGRGLGARYLYDLLKPNVDPLSPDNVVIMMTGPFTGTGIYACQKYEWVTKSPLTNMYLCSNTGGRLGDRLKRVGYDGIIIKGSSDTPKFLLIDTDKIELKDASFIWGKKVSESQMLIKESTGADAIACTGSAADLSNPVKFAGIYDGQRCSGRGGLGAVFGSKNLKAIAIVSHNKSKTFNVYNPDGLNALLKDLANEIRSNPITGEQLPKYGSIIWLDTTAEFGILPARNYQDILTYEDVEGKIDTKGFEKQVAEEESAFVNCLSCPIKSGHVVIPNHGEWAGKLTKGPEFETTWALGPNLGIIDYGHIITANKECNEYGIDTISTGGVIGFAMECYQRGLLNNVDSTLLQWGNSESVLKMIRKIAQREDWLGDMLAEGVRSASEKIGNESKKFALHVKGMEVPAYDPRGVWGMGLTYATACRGACHLKSWTVAAEFKDYDPTSTEGKAKLVKEIQDLRSVLDSLIVCFFAGRAITKDWVVKLVNTVTDFNWNLEDVDKCGSKIYTLERLLAVREGISKKDDFLPYRIMEEPIKNGRSKGIKIGKNNMEVMLKDYHLRGWDENGIPKDNVY